MPTHKFLLAKTTKIWRLTEAVLIHMRDSKLTELAEWVIVMCELWQTSVSRCGRRIQRPRSRSTDPRKRRARQDIKLRGTTRRSRFGLSTRYSLRSGEVEYLGSKLIEPQEIRKRYCKIVEAFESQEQFQTPKKPSPIQYHSGDSFVLSSNGMNWDEAKDKSLGVQQTRSILG